MEKGSFVRRVFWITVICASLVFLSVSAAYCIQESSDLYSSEQIGIKMLKEASTLSYPINMTKRFLSVFE